MCTDGPAVYRFHICMQMGSKEKKSAIRSEILHLSVDSQPLKRKVVGYIFCLPNFHLQRGIGPRELMYELMLRSRHKDGALLCLHTSCIPGSLWAPTIGVRCLPQSPAGRYLDRSLAPAIHTRCPRS